MFKENELNKSKCTFRNVGIGILRLRFANMRSEAKKVMKRNTLYFTCWLVACCVLFVFVICIFKEGLLIVDCVVVVWGIEWKWMDWLLGVEGEKLTSIIKPLEERDFLDRVFLSTI